MNVHREKGANAELIEVVKQMSEGGTSTIKMDRLTGFSEAKKTIGLSENKEKELILKMHTFHKNFKTAGIYHFCANLIQSQ